MPAANTKRKPPRVILEIGPASKPVSSYSDIPRRGERYIAMELGANEMLRWLHGWGESHDLAAHFAPALSRSAWTKLSQLQRTGVAKAVRGRVGTTTGLPFRTGSIHEIVLKDVLNAGLEPPIYQNLLREAHRVLKPGGLLHVLNEYPSRSAIGLVAHQGSLYGTGRTIVEERFEPNARLTDAFRKRLRNNPKLQGITLMRKPLAKR